MDFPAKIDGGPSKRNRIIRSKNISYRQQLFSTPQKLIKSTSRLKFGVISTPIDIKNTPILTPPSELPESPQIKFKIEKLIQYQVNFVAGCSNLLKGLLGILQITGDMRSPRIPNWDLHQHT